MTVNIINGDCRAILPTLSIGSVRLHCDRVPRIGACAIMVSRGKLA